MSNLLLNEKQLNEKVNDFYSVPDQIQGFKINRAGYGMVPKLVMLDKRLHVTAKAIYAYFCSYTGAGVTCFPSRKKICNDLDISTESFIKYSKQLVDVGYVEKKQIKEKGRFLHNLYTLLDEVSPCTEKTSQVLEKAEKICTSTVNGFSVHGKTDTKINSNIKINKKYNNININNNNLLKEKENNKRKRKEPFSLGEFEIEFEKIWNEYPRKEKKVLAKKYFFKKRKSGIKLDVLFEGLRKYKKFWTETKIEQKYIPHLSNWLNGERWNDECVQKCELNNPSYDISEYLKTMDTFASTDESNLIDDFNPADEIRKRQKQEKPVLDKLKSDKKDELFKKYGPKYANKILNTRTIESFYSSCRDVEQMIKERLIVWYKDGYIGLDEFEEMKEKENFENSVFPPKEPERESFLNVLFEY